MIRIHPFVPSLLCPLPQIIELLIATSFSGSQTMPHAVTLEARALYDEKEDEAESLARTIEAKALNCADSCWASSSKAKKAAKALTAVAVKCLKGAARRATPAEVLPELEAAAKGDFGASGSSWFGL